MSYTDRLQEIANKYMEAHEGAATAKEMASWAIGRALWKPQPIDLINQCAEQLARAMREEHIKDAQGRIVRAKHAARQGKLSIWADIRIASRTHMEIAFKQRRKQIVGDCHQLKVDADSYNENRCPSNPIQLLFDFRRDLEEMEAVA